MPRHLIYVPALTQAWPGAELAMTEADALRRAGVECDVAVVEHEPALASRRNRELLLRLSRAHPEVPVFHLTAHVVDEGIAFALAQLGMRREDRGWIRSVLVPAYGSYSAGPNKIAMFAAAHGYDVLHRRDGDVSVVAGHPDLSPEDALPALAEARLLGTLLGGTGDDDRPAPGAMMAGGSYVGEPPLDRRDLLGAGRELAVEFQALKDPDGDLAAAAAFVDAYLVEESSEYTGASLDRGMAVEMGVVSYRTIWRLVPEMPLRETLGSDYTAKTVLHAARRPVWHHGIPVRHQYGNRRATPTPDEAARYAVRDVRNLLLTRAWRPVKARDDVFTDPRNPTGPEYARALCAEWERVREEAREIPARAAAIYACAATRSPDPAAARLWACADLVESAGHCLVTDIDLGLQTFERLCSVWETMVDQVSGCAWPGSGRLHPR